MLDHDTLVFLQLAVALSLLILMELCRFLWKKQPLWIASTFRYFFSSNTSAVLYLSGLHTEKGVWVGGGGGGGGQMGLWHITLKGSGDIAIYSSVT